jgi:hypothetical protein
MWCAFESNPKILRCFCEGELIEREDMEFEAYLSHFHAVDREAVRRFIRFDIRGVESSCGMSVPYFDYAGERQELKGWAEDMARESRLAGYIADHETPPKL